MYRYVLAADCIYQSLPGEDDVEAQDEAAASGMAGKEVDWRVTALLDTLCALCSAGTQVLLSTQRRGSGQDIDDFFRLAHEKGFQTEQVDCTRHIDAMVTKAEAHPVMLVNIARCELYRMQRP